MEIYSKEDLRKELILNAHLLGHFGSSTTYERIKNQYFWRKMTKDIDFYLKRCKTCQRNNNMIPLEHKAKALKTNHIFQRVGLDIVSGFPTTDLGYCKILVIVEFMSKHVSIFPLKTKSAPEVAENLWLWIPRFGPPATILTDLGSEFINKTVENLINKLGIERRVTSPYHPRTNGLTERMNDTVTMVLRKHAAAAPKNCQNGYRIRNFHITQKSMQ